MLLLLAAATASWDVYLALNDVPGDTISEVVLEWSIRRPIVSFALGVLAGHLFWPQKTLEYFDGYEKGRRRGQVQRALDRRMRSLRCD